MLARNPSISASRRLVVVPNNVVAVVVKLPSLVLFRNYLGGHAVFGIRLNAYHLHSLNRFLQSSVVSRSLTQTSQDHGLTRLPNSKNSGIREDFLLKPGNSALDITCAGWRSTAPTKEQGAVRLILTLVAATALISESAAAQTSQED